MNKNRITALLCALLLIAGLLTGCKPAATQEDTAAVSAALEKLYACTSVTVSQLTVREETLTSEGESFVYSGSTAMDISLILEPELRVLLTTVIKIAYAGNSTEQSAVSYIVPENGGHTEYYKEGDSWYKVVADPEDGPLEMPISDTTKIYLTSGMAFRKAGSDELSGGSATRYECALEGEPLVDLLDANGHLSTIVDMSENQQQKIKDNLVKDLNPLTIRIWLDDASGYPVRFEMDMTATLLELNESIAHTLGQEASEEWTLNQFFMSLDLRDFNSVPDIAPPPEAADAELYDTSGSV